jgi:hypothetical protein
MVVIHVPESGQVFGLFSSWVFLTAVPGISCVDLRNGKYNVINKSKENMFISYFYAEFSA